MKEEVQVSILSITPLDIVGQYEVHYGDIAKADVVSQQVIGVVVERHVSSLNITKEKQVQLRSKVIDTLQKNLAIVVQESKGVVKFKKFVKKSQEVAEDTQQISSLLYAEPPKESSLQPVDRLEHVRKMRNTFFKNIGG